LGKPPRYGAVRRARATHDRAATVERSGHEAEGFDKPAERSSLGQGESAKDEQVSPESPTHKR
jgi:hypothetical protein